MRGVCQGGKDLFTSEPVLLLHDFERLTHRHGTHNRRHIDPSAVQARLPEPHSWIHRHAGKDFHTTESVASRSPRHELGPPHSARCPRRRDLSPRPSPGTGERHCATPACYTSPQPEWRNGRRRRLKISRPQGHAGSSPASGTDRINHLVAERARQRRLSLPNCHIYATTPPWQPTGSGAIAGRYRSAGRGTLTRSRPSPARRTPWPPTTSREGVRRSPNRRCRP
jgi:hypothetical protein